VQPGVVEAWKRAEPAKEEVVEEPAVLRELLSKTEAPAYKIELNISLEVKTGFAAESQLI
jgi:hypothetical protein